MKNDFFSQGFSNSEELSNALKQKASRHTNYKMYTSLNYARHISNDGFLYLTNGQNWNDTFDRWCMAERKVFSICFTAAISENIALWMLYGANRGKNGAMLNFTRTMLREICETKQIEIGEMDAQYVFTPKHRIELLKDEYDIFLTDVVYFDSCQNEKYKLSVGESHGVFFGSIVNHPDIFVKKYPWSYEKECRLVIRLSKNWMEKIENDSCTHVKITIPEKVKTELGNNRLIRSPIYEGNADIGRPSLLTGDVEWN
ncbi:MAG: DUF2971 domain-containing protein [Lachnospiraceae bacterium]|nr:DUF2971 domain-containing protein [Lachnospiraceae bacterium]